MAQRVTALADFLRREYGGDYQVKVSTIAAGVVPTKLVDHNFERMGLTLLNVGANAAYVSPDGNTSATHGVFLAANGGALGLSVRDDLALVGWEWYGLQSGGATNLVCVEVTRYKGES